MYKHGSSFSSVIAWALYDWGHSAFAAIITTFIFSSYFTQGIASNPIQGTKLWGDTIALSGLIIAVLSPFLGSIADKQGRRKPWIFVFTVITSVSAGLLWFSKPSPEFIQWTLTWVVIGTIAFEISYVFYNSMMHDLVEEPYLGRLSGLSWGLGYGGGVCSLIIALVLIQEGGSWFNLDKQTAEAIRLCGPLVGAWFLIFALPLFFKVPDRKKQPVKISEAIISGCTSFINNISKLKGYKHVGLFLIARMLFADGLTTLFVFGGIYAAGEFHLPPEEIVKFGIAMNVSAGLGAVIFAWLDDTIGSVNTMLLSLFFLIISLTALLFIKSIVLFWILALFMGLFVGPVQAASRTYMVRITPKERQSEFFGMYALSGKMTAFMGPWLVGMLTATFNSQRIGMSGILVFLVIGALLLGVIKNYHPNGKSAL